MSESVINEAHPVNTDTKCYHCGDACEETICVDEKTFCCYGCKTVYEILSTNGLCEYYQWDERPGLPLSGAVNESFAYLDEATIRKKVIEFDSSEFARVRFYIPSIHCASCIWLMENLEQLDRGILKSEVNFARKSVCIDFHPQRISLSKIASLLAKVGYAPQINLEKQKEKVKTTSLIIRLAVAGFCFGNVMLFSFPEYLGLDHHDNGLMRVFSFLNLALSIPVLLYSAYGYFKSAAKSFQQKQINIDVPIALGLIALFFQERL